MRIYHLILWALAAYATKELAVSLVYANEVLAPPLPAVTVTESTAEDPLPATPTPAPTATTTSESVFSEGIDRDRAVGPIQPGARSSSSNPTFSALRVEDLLPAASRSRTSVAGKPNSHLASLPAQRLQFAAPPVRAASRPVQRAATGQNASSAAIARQERDRAAGIPPTAQTATAPANAPTAPSLEAPDPAAMRQLPAAQPAAVTLSASTDNELPAEIRDRELPASCVNPSSDSPLAQFLAPPLPSQKGIETQKSCAAATPLPFRTAQQNGATQHSTAVSYPLAEGALGAVSDRAATTTTSPAPGADQNQTRSGRSAIAQTTNATASAPLASPLERPPIRLFNLETGNQLLTNAFQFALGLHQTLPGNGPGTGNQLYYGRVDWGFAENWQLGLTAQGYDDPPLRSINGAAPNITFLTIAPSVKYQLIENAQFVLGVQGSIEWQALNSSLWDTSGREDFITGSLQVPMSYTVAPAVQLHLTPGVSFFPDRLNGNDFYGTIFSLGSGVSWQPSNRWLVYGTLTLPLGPGGNTIDSDDQSVDNQLVWAVGTRYNVTPRVGIEVYGTNGFGITPATAVLTAIPDGSELLLGARLNYTPAIGLDYASTYRTTPAVELSDRDRQLQVDGFTVSTANTLQPGTFALTAGLGTAENYRLGLAYSPDQDLQLEAALERYADGDDISPQESAGDDLKYFLGARVRLLDQVQGDPLSLGIRVLGGRDTDDDQQVGALSLEVPVTYQLNPRTAFFLNPRLAAFGDEAIFGVGLGVNYEVLQGLQLIGEITPVFDDNPLVWAAGARYAIPQMPLSVDLYTTNAIGHYGLGTLLGDAARVGLSLNWRIGGR